MKIQLSDDIEFDEVKDKLKSIEIVDEGDFILIRKVPRVTVIGNEGNHYLEIQDILYVESFGNDVFVYSSEGKYRTNSRLYDFIQYDQYLLRISKSVVINFHKVDKILPSINMKFKIFINDSCLEVNRSYYNKFKEVIGI